MNPEQTPPTTSLALRNNGNATRKARKRLGRRSLLTPALQKRICDLLSQGNTIKTTCDACGISERVYYEWCEARPQFLQATTRVRAEAKIKLVKIITDAAAVDARHAEWLLERSHPQEYGRATKPPPPPPREPETYSVSDEELSKLLDSLPPLESLPPLA